MTCKPAPRQPVKPVAAGPQVRATVVTIRTVIEPARKTFTHTLVVLDGRARNTNELDTWRLYDVKARTVTFVDDVARTYRTESFDQVLESRRAVTAGALPAHYPPARFSATADTRPFLGIQARKSVIELGAYRRQLWIAPHPAIPDELYAMMHLSEPAPSPLAPMHRAVDEALAKVRGYPLLDRAEIAYGKGKHVVEHTVLGIAQQNVAGSLLSVPKDYTDKTPKPRPAAKK
ncbi:MAG: hypothetical protein QOH21_139 [Acidobacteriota bacterium]|nr:hypothetical protein [Acidobacteriota bacterium]